jgi:hypothetical protein
MRSVVKPDCLIGRELLKILLRLSFIGQLRKLEDISIRRPSLLLSTMPHFLTSSLTSPYTLQAVSINRNFSTKHGAPPVEPILRNVSVVAPAESKEEPLKWGKVQKMAIDDGEGENRLVSRRRPSHLVLGNKRG